MRLMIDRGIKKMLKSFGWTEENLKSILNSLGVSDNIYTYKAKPMTKDCKLWEVSHSDGDCFLNISKESVTLNYVRINYNGCLVGNSKYVTYEMLTDEEGFELRALSHDEVVYLGTAKIDYYFKENYSRRSFGNITYEDDNRKIIISCYFEIDIFEDFKKSFLNIYDSDDISIIDIIKCLPLDYITVLPDSSLYNKIEVTNKVTGNIDIYIIDNYKRKFLVNKNKYITLDGMLGCDGDFCGMKFTCGHDDYEVSVSVGKYQDINKGMEICFNFNIPIVYDILDYLFNLVLPVSIEEVYNKFLIFAKDIGDFPFVTVSIFNKGMEFTVQMCNGECIMMKNSTEKIGIEWEKDGSFRYEKKDTGSTVLIDKDLNAFYSGPVKYGLNSKVIDPNEILSYKAVLEAEEKLDEMVEISKEPFSRLRTK